MRDRAFSVEELRDGLDPAVLRAAARRLESLDFEEVRMQTCQCGTGLLHGRVKLHSATCLLRQLSPTRDSSQLRTQVENTVYRVDKASSSAVDSLTYTSVKWILCFAIGEPRASSGHELKQGTTCTNAAAVPVVVLCCCAICGTRVCLSLLSGGGTQVRHLGRRACSSH